MKEEYFDIVDENNNPNGERELRSEAHVKGYWHRTVHIYFFRTRNNSLEFLVHLRAKTKDLHPNCWDTRFGGHLKSGESVLEAALGEIKEEVGLQLSIEDLLEGKIIKEENYPNNEFVYVYFYKFDGDIKELKFEDDEVQEVKWMSAGDILKELSDNSNSWSGSAAGFKSISTQLKNLIKYEQ